MPILSEARSTNEKRCLPAIAPRHQLWYFSGRERARMSAMNISIRSSMLAVAAICSACVLTNAKAQNADLAIMSNLKKNLTSMGYEPQVEGKHAKIESDGFIVNFNVSKNNNMLYAYSYYSVPAETASKAPLVKMLEFNDTSDIFFSVHTENGKIDSVSLNISTPAKDMSPQVLRKMIDEISYIGHDQQALFDPSNWK